MTHKLTKRLLSTICICTAIFFLAAQAFAEPAAVTLYQDEKITIYDDTPSSGGGKEISYIHKVGPDTPLFDVTISDTRDQYGRGQIRYRYQANVIAYFQKLLPEIYADDISYVTINHFIIGHDLPPLEGVQNTVRGRPIATIILKNLGPEKTRSNPNRHQDGSMKSDGSLKIKPEWQFYLSDTDQPYKIERNFLNTFNLAANWERQNNINEQRYENNRNAQRSLVAEVIGGNAKTKSDSAEEFGYASAQLILKTGKTEYFLLDSEIKGLVKLVAVHAVGEEDWLADMDIFPIAHRKHSSPFIDGLGFLYSEKEIAAFNRQLAPILNKLKPERGVWIYHYVKGKPLPECPNQNQTKSCASKPVFVSEFFRSASSGNWEQSYVSGHENARRFGNFDSFQTRYSYASTLRYIKEFKKNSAFIVQGKKSEVWMAEADEAYRHATPEARARRSKSTLWTRGYWHFLDLDVARNLIDGEFTRIAEDDYFASFYTMYLHQYSKNCGEFIQNPKSLRLSTTRKIRDRFGTTWTKVLNEDVINVADRFAAQYEKYYNYGAPGGFKWWRGDGITAGDLQAIQSFIVIEECQSPTQIRLQENLYRRGKGLPALTAQ